MRMTGGTSEASSLRSCFNTHSVCPRTGEGASGEEGRRRTPTRSRGTPTRNRQPGGYPGGEYRGGEPHSGRPPEQPPPLPVRSQNAH